MTGTTAYKEEAQVGSTPVEMGYSTSSGRYEESSVFHEDEYDRTKILLEWTGKNKRVLEIGCSTGYITRRLTQAGCSVTGIEIDPVAAEKARDACERLLIRDLNSPNCFDGLPTCAFDVVLMADVLEHLANPTAILGQVSDLLESGGSVLVSLPNVAHWITRLEILCGQFEYRSTGTLDHTHLRFFTVKTAARMIELAGYRVIRFWPAIGGRMSGHARPVWQALSHRLPGLFAYQMLFEAKKVQA